MIIPNNNSERRPPTACRGQVHVVQDGDTLYKIAKQYDVKLFDLMRLNPYVNVYNLQRGDEICIPAIPMRPEKTYVVNQGDTIQRVMQVLDFDFDTLARWNPMLKDIELPEGLIISVPLVQPRNDLEDLIEDFFDDKND